MAGEHVQVLVDLVVPKGRDKWDFITWVIDALSAEAHRMGVQESVWVVPSTHGDLRPD